MAENKPTFTYSFQTLMNRDITKSPNKAQHGNAPKLKIGKAFHISPTQTPERTTNCKSNCNYSSAASSNDFSYSDHAEGGHAKTDHKTEETDSIFMDRGVQFI